MSPGQPPAKRAKLDGTVAASDIDVAAPQGHVNLIEVDGKSCTHEVAWPPGERGNRGSQWADGIVEAARRGADKRSTAAAAAAAACCLDGACCIPIVGAITCPSLHSLCLLIASSR